jgi:hypothetical protein
MGKEFKYVLLGIIILLVLLWWTRYQMINTPNYTYRMNRLTGNVEILINGGMTNVIKIDQSRGNMPAPETAPAPPPSFEKKPKK